MTAQLLPQAPDLADTAHEPTLRAGPALDKQAFTDIRRRMVLEFCKWDPQVQDVSTLAPFPLLVRREQWEYLAATAEALFRETIAIERNLLERPHLLDRLGLPRRLRHLPSQTSALTPPAARVMRFDFHPTPHGWRISEVNSDVPGGFTEASAFARLMSKQTGASILGDPVETLADAVAHRLESPDPIALISAPGFMEDHQVVCYLARVLRQRGIAAHLASATHLRWTAGHAHLDSAWYRGKLSAIVRFYQGEWLARLKRRLAWQNLFVDAKTPVCNPGSAILTESKRLPLIWDELALNLSTWRKLLPETRDPRHAPWRTSDDWLVKSAYCNTGDSVAFPGLLPRRQWLATQLDVFVHPHQWIAQKRFDTLHIDTPNGAMSPCIGVFVIDGRCAGAYGRLSRAPVIAYNAIDAAVLLAPPSLILDHDP